MNKSSTRRGVRTICTYPTKRKTHLTTWLEARLILLFRPLHPEILWNVHAYPDHKYDENYIYLYSNLGILYSFPSISFLIAVVACAKRKFASWGFVPGLFLWILPFPSHESRAEMCEHRSIHQDCLLFHARNKYGYPTSPHRLTMGQEVPNFLVCRSCPRRHTCLFE